MSVVITDGWFVGGWFVVSGPDVVSWEVVLLIDGAIEEWVDDIVSDETIVMLVGLSVIVEAVDDEPLTVSVDFKVDVTVEDKSSGVVEWKFVVSVVNADGRFVEDWFDVSVSDVVFWEVAVDDIKSVWVEPKVDVDGTMVTLLVDDGIGVAVEDDSKKLWISNKLRSGDPDLDSSLWISFLWVKMTAS